MLAIDDSTSIDWAREIRGTASIARAVIGRCARASTRPGFSAGASRLISVVPSPRRPSSSADGALTFSTTSAAQASSAGAIRAPAAV
jgi:hypothetical protein